MSFMTRRTCWRGFFLTGSSPHYNKIQAIWQVNLDFKFKYISLDEEVITRQFLRLVCSSCPLWDPGWDLAFFSYHLGCGVWAEGRYGFGVHYFVANSGPTLSSWVQVRGPDTLAGFAHWQRAPSLFSHTPSWFHLRIADRSGDKLLADNIATWHCSVVQIKLARSSDGTDFSGVL